jgi:hypothetical protein
MTAIRKAVEILGEVETDAKRPHKGYSLLAEKLGVPRGHVWMWVNRQKRAPAKYFKDICIATGMRVTPNALMDDHNKE